MHTESDAERWLVKGLAVVIHMLCQRRSGDVVETRCEPPSVAFVLTLLLLQTRVLLCDACSPRS